MYEFMFQILRSPSRLTQDLRNITLSIIYLGALVQRVASRTSVFLSTDISLKLCDLP